MFSRSFSFFLLPLLVSSTAVCAQNHAAASVSTKAMDGIERIEPPFWWVGMRQHSLQLMVHGPAIGASSPQLDYPGVRITAIRRVSNPNYLFVDLDIADGTQPGELDLFFSPLHDAGTAAPASATLHYHYRLQARDKDSAQRRGFSAADAILNLVPDRFANGDRSNDTMAGFPDRLSRGDDSAGRHGGDIRGIADHLDYIAGMGYTMIWPTPLIENNQPAYSYHGYATTDHYKIDARFGSNEDYRQLVAQARSKGVGVIQDIVLNHIGDHHWWMRDLPSADWITFNGQFVPTRHARTTVSDPYASRADHRNFTEGWFSEHMPDMNQANPLVATYQIQNSIWWIEYAGLSGIRADTYSYSEPAFLAAWSRRILEEYPHFSMVGEEWSTNPNVVARWLRGKHNPDGYVSSMPAMMDFPLQDALRQALVAEDSWNGGLTALYEMLVNDQLYPDPSAMVLFEGNHDMSRLYTALNNDPALVKMALAYIATMPRTPQFYYGTEVLMQSRKQRDDGAARRDFPGGWTGDKVNAFTGAGLTAEQRTMQQFVRRLLNWRKTQPVIHHGKLMHFAPDQGTYTYFRYQETAQGMEQVMVVLNKNRSATTLPTARFAEILPSGAQGTDVLNGQQYDLRQQLTVPPRSALILQISAPGR